jgi:outer membrane protein assembly factor BamD (BamD/ComL family)
MKAIAKKTLSTVALAVALVLGAGGLSNTACAAAAEQKPSVSKASVKPISEAQKAIQAKKFEEAVAKLNEVDSIAARTPYDTFAAAQLRAYALSQLGRMTEAVPFYVAEIESGFLPADEAAKLSRGVTQLYYQNKDYAKTAEWGQKSLAAGYGDADTWFFIAHAHYLQKDFAKASQVANDYLADAMKKGEKPKENPLLVLLQASAQGKDNGAVQKALELLVQNYPKPEYWRDLLVTVRDASGRGTASENYTFNIYRLMRETGTLKESNDFLEMAQLGISQGSPGEAGDALRRGTAANAFTTESDKSGAAKLGQTAKALEDTDRAGLGKFETEAKAAKAGEGDVRLGQALLSYDQAEKALEAIQRGIGKGSLRNADEAQILLGITLLRLNRKADAAMAFAAVKGTDPRLGNLARLWGYLARS